MKKSLIIGMSVLLASCNTAVDVEQQVDELYGKMSQEERIAQLKWHRSFLPVCDAEAS